MKVRELVVFAYAVGSVVPWLRVRAVQAVVEQRVVGQMLTWLE